MNEESAPQIKKPKSRWKKVCLVLGLLLAAVAGIIWLLLPPKEPSYNGKPLSYWLARYAALGFVTEDTTDPKAIESRDAIRHIGTNALPTLLRMLRARDSALKMKLVDWSERQDYVHLNFSSAPELNTRAALGFYCLGDLATSSIPELVALYTNSPSESSKDSADSALKSLYPAPGVALPYWIPPEERVEWYRETGRLKIQTKAFSNAVLAFSEAIKLAPTNATDYLSRAEVRFQLLDFPGALGDSRRSIELNSRNDTAYYFAGLCQYALKDFKSADDYFTASINLNTNSNEAYNYRSLTRANLHKLDDAIADCNQSVRLSPDDPYTYRNRAMVEGMQKKYEQAVVDASKSIDLNGKDAKAYLIRARVKNALKDYKSALADFDRALELDPTDPTAYASRGACNVFTDDFASANADLEKALQLNPKTVIAYVIRGYLEAKRGQDDEALADFQHAVDLSPVPETIATLGFFQYKTSHWVPALENCRKALAQGAASSTADLRSYIWLIRAQSGEEADASHELETYLKSLSGAKANEWEASIARFLSGSLSESNFLAQATTTAKRPSAIKGQVCESFYYAGMKHKLAGDQPAAAALFQKSLDTGDDNNLGYLNAAAELRALKKQ